ncbi:MAG: GGDEF domain-containing protein [Alphaproteobacteria bacterium]|nr:GGDEF domain-containing protein [Alphaproteobacteria bacterium]
MKKDTTDPLTGLMNRRGLDVFFAQEEERLRRKQSSGAMFIIDLDRFKPANDTYGHQAGDACLKEAGNLHGRVVRRLDGLARRDGDEFVVMLLHVRPAEAERKLEALQQALDEINIVWQGKKAPVPVQRKSPPSARMRRSTCRRIKTSTPASNRGMAPMTRVILGGSSIVPEKSRRSNCRERQLKRLARL